jgi:hypothetical protein
MAYTLNDLGNTLGSTATGVKNQLVNLFAPSAVAPGDYNAQAAEYARQQKLADMLSQMGAQDIPVSTAGGITAPISPWAALAKGLESGAGSYMGAKAAGDQAALKKAQTADALAQIGKLYTLPDTTGLVPSTAPAGTTSTPFTVGMPTLPGQKPSDVSATANLDLPNAPGVQTSTIPGGARPYADQLKMLNKWAIGDNAVLAAAAPTLAAQLKPEYKEVGANGLVRIDPSTGKATTVVGPKAATPDALMQKGMIAYGPNYLTDPRFKADVVRDLQGLDSDAKVAQMMSIFGQKTAITTDARKEQYSLSDQENDALFGPNGAVTRGLINPDRINSRTGRIFAKAAMSNPDLNMVNAAGVAALMKNPTFQNRVIIANTIPAIIENVKDAGQKVDFSDVNYIGKLQAWEKKQLNDPDFINYIGQRNDAVQSIASVMRGVGMSDKSVELELEAAPLTMSPKAFDAWAAGQLTSLKPRLEKYQGVTLNTNAPGGQQPTAPAQGGAAAPGGAGNVPHPQDQAAITWARAHPTDRRSADILTANGVK